MCVPVFSLLLFILSVCVCACIDMVAYNSVSPPHIYVCVCAYMCLPDPQNGT
jgi:hypothetical protein